MTNVMDAGRLKECVAELNEDSNGWDITSSDKLARKFKFSDFAAAWSFMSRVALFAERTNHHPEWCNVYNVVDVELTTHDSGGITDKDIALAEYMNEAARSLTPPP